MVSRNAYFERRDKYIKTQFQDCSELSHPCKKQQIKCLNGEVSCPFIGLPNDACVFYIRGNCKFGDDKCKYHHYKSYADIYQKAKEEFYKADKKLPVVAARYFQVAKPYLIGIWITMFPQIVRHIIDFLINKVF